MRKIYLFIVAAIFAGGACQMNSTQQNSAQTANKENVVTNRPIQDKQVAWGQQQAAKLGVQQPKYYPGTGVLTKINKNSGEVEIDHQEIKDKTPAQKSKFQVKEKENLQNLKVGDTVVFVVESDAGKDSLSSLMKKSATK